MARCVDDLKIMLDVLFKPKYYENVELEARDFHWEPKELGPLPTGKLRIAYIKEFDLWRLPNCMKRAVKEACDALGRD